MSKEGLRRRAGHARKLQQSSEKLIANSLPAKKNGTVTAVDEEEEEQEEEEEEEEEGVVVHISLYEVLIGLTTVWTPTLLPALLLLMLSLITRLHALAEPPSVAWDETHFGKFANHYLNHTFYFDVHPPLAKMTIALAGHLTGYDGDFAFTKPGDVYGDGVNYVGMRAACAIFGALCVPLAFAVVREVLPSSPSAAMLAGMLVLCETSFVTISRFILLDPILMFFVMLSAFTLFRFANCTAKPFSWRWWFWLEICGVALGCALSCKFVGAFVVSLAGIHTVCVLWHLLGDLKVSPGGLMLHICARVVGLIITPLAVYSVLWLLHLSLLHRTGAGDSFMSSAFQMSLQGNPLRIEGAPEYLAYGSVITLRAAGPGAGLLHSHPHLSPEGMIQHQQVTAYHHRDANNLWVVKHAQPDTIPGDRYDNMTATACGVSDCGSRVQYVKSGDRIRLEHKLTRRNLHSHDAPAPITKGEGYRQVTCYGQDGRGDLHDEWTIWLAKDNSGGSNTGDSGGGGGGDRIGRIDQYLRLEHGYEGRAPNCALVAVPGARLPEWGFQQGEVVCSAEALGADTSFTSGRGGKRGLWVVETHTHPHLPNAPPPPDKVPSFWAILAELHAAMFSINAALVPKEGEPTSRPWEWPITRRGQRFTAWGSGDHRVVLLGNPIVFGGVAASASIFLILCFSHAVLRQRKYVGFPWDVSVGDPQRWPRSQRAAAWLFLGWALHYVPFFAMDRVLYFHHYMPAHIFACMATGVILDYLTIVVAQWWNIAAQLAVRGGGSGGCGGGGSVDGNVGRDNSNTDSSSSIQSSAINSSDYSVSMRSILAATCALCLMCSFVYFHPLAYGMKGPLADALHLQWGQHWQLAV